MRTWKQVMEAGSTTKAFARSRCLETAMRQLDQVPVGVRSAASFTAMTNDNGHLHPGLAAPAGAVYLWTGGSSGNGHVAVSAGEHWCWTVDWTAGLSLTRVPVEKITAAWSSLDFAGWASWYGTSKLDTRPPLVLSISRVIAAQRPEQTAPRRQQGYGPQALLLERALDHLGHSPGPLDGHLGRGYTAAVRSFQKSIGDDVDGYLGRKQAMKLLVMAGMDDRADVMV